MKDFCIYSKKCSSCHLCNLSMAEQLRYKENICRRTVGKLCRVEPITPSPKTEGYRNKAQFVFKREGKGLVSGLYKSSTHSVMVAQSCTVCSDTANEIVRSLCKLFFSFKVMPYDPYTGRGWLKSVVIREAVGTNEVMAVINGADAVSRDS